VEKGNETMETTEERSPLRITITETGQENLVLRALLRQAVPMLLKPEAFPLKQRCQLAQDVTLILEGALTREDDPSAQEGTESGYAPGHSAETEEVW
jgi:hypothetical protein